MYGKLTGVLLLLFATLKVAHPALNRKARIISGEASSPNHFPWIVFVLIGDGAKPSATGTLIRTDYVMSSASIFRPKQVELESIKVSMGESTADSASQNTVAVKALQMHPCYRMEDQQSIFDLCLLQLKEPYASTATIQVIPLPSFTDKDQKYYLSRAVTVGWGPEAGGGGEALRFAPMMIIPNFECVNQSQVFGDDAMMCVKGIGGAMASGADIGAPLLRKTSLIDMVQIGMFSFSLGTDDPELPQGYLRIGKHLEWIGAVMDGDALFKPDCQNYPVATPKPTRQRRIVTAAAKKKTSGATRRSSLSKLSMGVFVFGVANLVAQIVQ